MVEGRVLVALALLVVPGWAFAQDALPIPGLTLAPGAPATAAPPLDAWAVARAVATLDARSDEAIEAIVTATEISSSATLVVSPEDERLRLLPGESVEIVVAMALDPAAPARIHEVEIRIDSTIANRHHTSSASLFIDVSPRDPAKEADRPIRGIVTDERGAPIAGATVTIGTGGWSHTLVADAGGSFSLGVPDHDAWQISASAPARAPEHRPIRAEEGPFVLALRPSSSTVLEARPLPAEALPGTARVARADRDETRLLVIAGGRASLLGASGRPLATFGTATVGDVSPDGRFVALAGPDGIAVHEETGARLWSAPKTAAEPVDLRFTRDGAAFDVLDAAGRLSRHALEGESLPVVVDLSSEGRALLPLLGGEVVVSTVDGRLRRLAPTEPEPTRWIAHVAGGGAIDQLDLSVDARTIAVGTATGVLSVVDATDGSILGQADVGGPIEWLAIFPGGDRVLVGGAGAAGLSLRDQSAGLAWRLDTLTRAGAIAITGETFAVAAADRVLILSTSGEPLGEIPVEASLVRLPRSGDRAFVSGVGSSWWSLLPVDAAAAPPTATPPDATPRALPTPPTEPPATTPTSTPTLSTSQPAPQPSAGTPGPAAALLVLAGAAAALALRRRS